MQITERIKTMHKRILSVFIVILMLACVGSPALAAENTKDIEPLPFSWEAYEFVANYLQNNGYLAIAGDGTLEILPFPEGAFNPLIVNAIKSYVNDFINLLVQQGMIYLDAGFNVYLTEQYYMYTKDFLIWFTQAFGFDYRTRGIHGNSIPVVHDDNPSERGMSGLSVYWYKYEAKFSNDVITTSINTLYKGLCNAFFPAPIGGRATDNVVPNMGALELFNVNQNGVVVRFIYSTEFDNLIAGVWAQ
jgi:hypothetical protein